MSGLDWHLFYQGDLQSVYALLVVPVAFLAYRLVAVPDATRAIVPDAARFVSGLTLFFAFETLIDPIATGPMLKQSGLANTVAASLIPFLFVYLGDFRVLWLVSGVAHSDRDFNTNLGWAAVVSLIVPVWAGVSFGLTSWMLPEVEGQVLWMLYEFGFVALCVVLGRFWIPRHVSGDPTKIAFLQSILGYSAAYYTLWLAADFLIVAGGLDLGWAVRIVPNQLYYAFWVPFVYWRFFSGRPVNADR